MEKAHIGLAEKIKIVGVKGEVETLAKVDTGASNNSLDHKIAAMAGVGPVVGSTKIKSASAPGGYKRRPVVEVVIEIKGKKYKTRANLEDREGMRYKALIGRELIHENFIVDVAQSHNDIGEEDLNPDLEKKTGLDLGEVKFNSDD